jgi:hypothetical protein
MDDIATRLRRWTHSADAVPASDLMEEAADELERLGDLRDSWHKIRSKLEQQIKFLEGGSQAEMERLRQERNHWMAAARAFDDHLATMRVMIMEHPTVRFEEPRY